MFKNSESSRKLKNKEFISQKNIRMTLLLSDIDSPQSNDINLDEGIKQQYELPQCDSLTLLLSKAQQITSKQPKITKTRIFKQSQAETENDGNAFLTGVGIVQQEQQNNEKEQTTDLLDDQVIKMLNKKCIYDDLEQLRKQIKQADCNLRSYQRKVLGTKKKVTNLAGRYNSYFDLKMSMNNPTVDFLSFSKAELKNFKKNPYS